MTGETGVAMDGDKRCVHYWVLDNKDTVVR